VAIDTIHFAMLQSYANNKTSTLTLHNCRSG
jgi:hypothetical protein